MEELVQDKGHELEGDGSAENATDTTTDATDTSDADNALHHKYLWPSKLHDCGRCWDDDGVNFCKDMIYKYLKLEYGQRDDISIEYKKRIVWQKEEKERERNHFLPLVPFSKLTSCAFIF